MHGQGNQGIVDVERQPHHPTQSTEKAGEQHTPKQPALAIESRCDVIGRIQDHCINPAPVPYKVNTAANQHKYPAHAMDCMSANGQGQHRRCQQNQQEDVQPIQANPPIQPKCSRNSFTGKRCHKFSPWTGWPGVRKP